MEFVLGIITLISAIGIIAIVGSNTIYEMARADYEADREKDFEERIANANIETRIEIKWING